MVKISASVCKGTASYRSA